MAKAPDPKEDPEFKAVVQHFLNTKPKPHKTKAGGVKGNKKNAKPR